MPLPAPEWKWSHIIMNFVTGFSQSLQGHDAIYVVVGRSQEVRTLPTRPNELLDGQVDTNLPQRSSPDT